MRKLKIIAQKLYDEKLKLKKKHFFVHFRLQLHKKFIKLLNLSHFYLKKFIFDKKQVA